MKPATVPNRLLMAPFLVALLNLGSAVWGETIPFLFEPDAAAPPDTLLWATEPGVRYDLFSSDNLDAWDHVTGFPTMADSLVMSYGFTPGDRGFFKIVPIDEQPPVLVAQYPAVDGFAVGRFADLSIQLSDATGIDPASIQLTVGSLGTFGQAAVGLTFASNTVTFDSGGDTALGAWGETITATLVVADTLGHTLTHTWSFRLEPEPQVAGNIFVFGSPTAQRTGQRVSGPAAALAARFPAPAGPQKANDPPPWHIVEVLADRIVIAYEAGGAPTFTAGQLVCNLTPTKLDEIFYRRVLSASDDPPNLRLSVMTEEADLTDFVSQGATELGEDVVAFETGADGTIVRAIEFKKQLRTFGSDLSGAEFTVEHQPTGLDVVKVEFEELYWRLKQPTISGGAEIGHGGIPKAFHATISGPSEYAMVVDVDVLALGYGDEVTVAETPDAILLSLPFIGPVPIFATVSANIKVKIAYETKADVNLHFGYRGTGEVLAGVDWEGGFSLPDFDWGFQKGLTGSDPFTWSLQGESSIGVRIVPEFELLFYGIAGYSVEFPLAGDIKVKSTAAEPVSWWFEAGIGAKMGLSGLFFESLSFTPGLSVPFLEGEWKLWPDDSAQLAFKTHPQSRTGAPGVDVSFTCAVDSPSPPSFQWFHDGRAIPGQTARSLFLTRITSGHAGSYFVRAKAGALASDSNPATLTVQAVTPENLDSDGDGIPDIHETGTGVWVSTTDRGTDPFKWETDGDGLSDGVETNTRSYASRGDTGTDPNDPDTDGDGVNDKREIDLGTNPNAGPAPDGFALVPAGNFQMGDQSSPLVGYSDERPVHSVYVSAFYMGKYEVTKELWDEVRTWGLANGYTDLPVGDGKAAKHPVHSITWYDMVKWCNARSQKENLTPCYTVSGVTYKTGSSAPVCNWSANGYRLPSEAEWEKAARGGVTGKNFPWGDTITHSHANYRANSSAYSYDTSGYTSFTYHPTYAVGGLPYSSPVGSFAPNGYGLYDMAGNMWEWCWDWYGYYGSSPATDPRGAASGAFRVSRGGGWFGSAGGCRVASRYVYDAPGYSINYFGFRLARSSVP